MIHTRIPKAKAACWNTTDKERLVGDGAEERERPEPWSLACMVKSLDFILCKKAVGISSIEVP